MKNIFLLLSFLVSTYCLGQGLSASEDLALLRVKVTDMEGKIRARDKIIFFGKMHAKSFEGVSNETGLFEILLPEGDVYQIKIQGLGSQIDFDEVNIPAQEGLISGNLEVRYRPEQQFTLDDVHFETNKAVLLKGSFPALDELVQILQLKPTLQIEIAGHTDSVGDDESNLELSQNRAQAVVNYLIQKGVDITRLTPKGYGETQPIADNETKEGRQENRRTEARILSE